MFEIIQIVLSGMDGSGKSSYAYNLRCLAKKKGVPLKTIWSRRWAVSLPLLAFCRFTGITNVFVNKNGFRVSEYRFYHYAPLRLIWPWVQFLDWFLYYCYLNVRGVFSKASIVFDRYTIDAFVDILADVRKPYGANLLEKIFICSFAQKVRVIVLDVNEKTSLSRKKDIPNLSYLSRRRQIYAHLAKKYGWPIVSTDEPFSLANQNVIRQASNWGLFT